MPGGLEDVGLTCVGLLARIATQAQVNVTTWHNDQARTGANTHEQVLTSANVNVNQVSTCTTGMCCMRMLLTMVRL